MGEIEFHLMSVVHGWRFHKFGLIEHFEFDLEAFGLEISHIQFAF
jgi:hypothetical protein